MSDFIVLHFTDLHIKKENITKYNLLFKKIVSYINDIKDESNSFIIIFGGDIIDRNNNCEVSIKCFSEFVNNIICGINNDVNKNIYIVFAGGNHDLCTDICYTCTRCDEVKSFLNSIERNVNQFIEKNLCEIEDDCTCSKIINSRDKHKLFDDVHRKKIKDKVIEEIFEHKTCKIFDKEKYNGRKTNGIEMLKEITYYNIKSATQDISNNIFKIKHNILKYYNYSETYKNYISLIDKLKENYKDKNNINIVSFVDDNFVNGFKKIEIKNRLNIGILNLNTSWLSTNGDHLNYKNLYIINENRIKNCGFNRKDSKNDFNILILHHPLEYISDNCTQTVEYLKNMLPKKTKETQKYLSENIINIGYCGHIHKNSDVAEDAQAYKSLSDYQINIPGCLIPPKDLDLENYIFDIEELIKIPNTKIGREEHNDIGFFVTKVNYNENGTEVDIINNRVFLQKNKLSTK